MRKLSPLPAGDGNGGKEGQENKRKAEDMQADSAILDDTQYNNSSSKSGGTKSGLTSKSRNACKKRSLADLFLCLFPIDLLTMIATETNRYGNEEWVRPATASDNLDDVELDEDEDDNSEDEDGSDEEGDEEDCQFGTPAKRQKLKNVFVTCQESHSGARHRYNSTKIAPWRNVTPGFLLVYFGILILHGARRTRRITWIWSDEYYCKMPAVTNAMTLNAFTMIRRMIHFGNTKTLRPTDKKRITPIQKVQPIVNEIDKNLREHWSLGKEFYVDETSIHYQGKFVSFAKFGKKMDRKLSDWTVSLHKCKSYMRVFFWMLDTLIHTMYLIVKEMGALDGDPWKQYCFGDGRMKFQLALGHALIERGILLDCPNAAQLKDKEKRPPYMRKNDFDPCACRRCFFCKNQFTRGIVHKQAPGPRFRVPLCPPSPVMPQLLSKDHPTSRVELKKHPMDCVVCKKKMKEMYPEKTTTQLRQERKINATRLGCTLCASGEGAVVCETCWNGYNHDM